MPTSRIFISYVHAGDERGTEIARRLIADLRSSGIEIVTDDEYLSDESFMAFLNRELPRCHYFIFIQTPMTLKSLRAQTAVNTALTLAMQQHTPKVLRLIAVSSEENTIQSQWNAARVFDASIDYPRACAKLFLELDLIRSDESSPALTAISSPLPEATVPPPSTPLPRATSFSGISSGNLPPMQPTNVPQPIFSGQLTVSAGQFAPVNTQLAAVYPPSNSQSPEQVVPYGPPTFPPLPMTTSIPPDAYYPRLEGDDRPVSRRRGMFRYVAFLPQLIQTLQTRTSEASGKPTAGVLLEDHPLPLNTTRRRVIRWASVIALVLVLTTGTTVALVQNRNHAVSGPGLKATTTVHSSPTPSQTKNATGTPQVFPTQGIVMTSPDPQSPIDIYASGSVLTLNDNLAGNDSKYQWQVSNTGTAGCQFNNGAYNLSSATLQSCLASKSNFANFVYQIQLKIVQGTTAGVVFRANATNHTSYFFQITVDGHFSLWHIDSAQASPILIAKTAGFAGAIRQGFNQPNVIAISAIGNHIICFVNKTPVVDIHDKTYTSGSVGVIAGQGTNNGQDDASYQYAKVWTLP